MSGPVAEATAKTPYLVTRRLRSLTAKEVRTQDRHAMAWVSQAADLISELANERKRLATLLSNHLRNRVRVVRTEPKTPEPAPIRNRKKAEASPRVGKVVAAANPLHMAIKIADMIDQPVDLYRAKSGGVRVVRAGLKMKGCQHLGWFDEGATIQQIAKAVA